MSEQVHRQRQTTPQHVGEVSTHPAASVRPQGTDAGLDDLLDSIDAVLETNAEEYVRSFVQKGGQ